MTDSAASDDRFCVCGAERGHYGSERCKPKPTLTDDTLPPFCEVHGCRGRWDDDRHNLCGKATTTAASDDGGMEPNVETLQAEYAEIEAEQERLLRRKLEIADRLAPLGLHEHAHGAGLYSDPYRDHAHPFTDPEHTHEPRSADDAPWPEVDY